ncbi:MAG: hypothetical protein HC915_08185 [Anaerolineae bacterium]|nr:hypothetical protein [Anaerolineae bacterium]
MAISLSYQARVLSVLTVALGCLLCAWQVSSATPGPETPAMGPAPLTHPLQAPVWLPGLLIYRPLEADALVTQPRPASEAQHHDWLRGTPLQFMAFRSAGQVVLLWRTPDAFWSAQLAADGQQISAPIRVHAGPVSTFSALADPAERLHVAWIAEGRLFYTLVDRLARPRPASELAPGARAVALGQQANQVRIAWGSQQQLYVATLNRAAPRALPENVQAVNDFALPEGAELSSLNLLPTDSGWLVLWGWAAPAQPDVEQYTGAHLLPNGTQELLDLRLPDNPPLRWAMPHGNSLTIAAWQRGSWRALHIGWVDGAWQVRQRWPGPPVTASPIALQGEGAAWATLDDAGLPRLFRTDEPTGFPEEGRASASRPPEGLVRFAAAPLALTWLILGGATWRLLRHHDRAGISGVGRLLAGQGGL